MVTARTRQRQLRTTCPRCHQKFAVKHDRDQYGNYALCMSCGWTNNGAGHKTPLFTRLNSMTFRESDGIGFRS